MPTAPPPSTRRHSGSRSSNASPGSLRSSRRRAPRTTTTSGSSRSGRMRPVLSEVGSACTTWRGKCRRSTTSPPPVAHSPTSARSSGRATTARPSRSTAGTPTATSSRSCGSSRATSGATTSTTRRSSRSTSTPSSPAGADPSGSAVGWLDRDADVDALAQRSLVVAGLDAERLLAVRSDVAGDGQETRQLDRVLAPELRLVAPDLELGAGRHVLQLDGLPTCGLRSANAEHDSRSRALLQCVLVDLVRLDAVQRQRGRRPPARADTHRRLRERDGERPQLVAELRDQAAHGGIEVRGDVERAVDEHSLRGDRQLPRQAGEAPERLLDPSTLGRGGLAT